MKTVAEFAGLKFRAVDPGERDTIEEWISADPMHRFNLTPEDFMGLFEDGREDPRPTCLALEDEKGTIFYVRISRAARVTIQFPPSKSRDTRVRNAGALIEGMALLESVLQRTGVEEWIFNTRNPALRSLARSHMSFMESTHELVKPIAPPAAVEGADEALQSQQHQPGEES